MLGCPGPGPHMQVVMHSCCTCEATHWHLAAALANLAQLSSTFRQAEQCGHSILHLAKLTPVACSSARLPKITGLSRALTSCSCLMTCRQAEETAAFFLPCHRPVARSTGLLGGSITLATKPVLRPKRCTGCVANRGLIRSTLYLHERNCLRHTSTGSDAVLLSSLLSRLCTQGSKGVHGRSGGWSKDA